jgi:3-oxoacyl-ACP reductase-like protein
MSLSISPVSTNPTPGSAVATDPTPRAAPAPAPAAAATEAATVQISVGAQVKQLDASGATVAEIVLKTGLDAATVKQYLGT